MYFVDLNSDLGESFGNYTLGMDEEILKYVSSANVACGWHAGDPVVMEKTICLAKEFGTAVGAHPGFPDLMGFGRRNMAISQEEAKAYVKYQLGALMAFTKSKGMEIQHVKPHGAIYNMAAVDETLARAMCEAVYIVTGSLKPYLFLSRQTVEPLLQQGKALAVIPERPRGLDGVTNLVYDGAVVFELGNVDSYKVHGFLLFLYALLFPHLTCPCTHANSNVKR